MSQTLPPIVMSCRDHAQLSRLARIVGSEHPKFCDFLRRELDRAAVVAPEEIGPTTVTMGSRVEFAHVHSGIRQVVTLVFPPEADVARGRVSVLTPVGMALIGLAEGQSIAFRTPLGEEKTLLILNVRHPDDALADAKFHAQRKAVGGEEAMSPTLDPNRERREDRGAESAPADAKVVPLVPRIRESAGPDPVGSAADTEDNDPGPSAA